MLRYLPFLLVLALCIYAFIDCLNTPEEEVKGLPKVVWIAIILLFGEVLIGPVAWLLAGKKRKGAAGGLPWEQGRRERFVAPDDNPEFLKSLGEDKPLDGEKSRDGEPESARSDAPKNDEALLKDWEEDLRRREEELRRREKRNSDDEP